MLGALLAGMPTIQPLAFVFPGVFRLPAQPGRRRRAIRRTPFRTNCTGAYSMQSLGQDGPSGVGLRGNIMRTPGHRQNVFALESLVNEGGRGPPAPIPSSTGWTTSRSRASPTCCGRRRPRRNGARAPRPTRTRGAAARRRSPGAAWRRSLRFGACWVGIAEVEVAPSTGDVRVTRFTLGVDPGKIINPRHLRRNMEGGIMMGLGEALKEEVVFDRGKVTSDNWRRYPIPTMADMPEIRLVQTSRDDAGFGGGGEAANTVPAPAIAAAVFDALGVQPRPDADQPRLRAGSSSSRRERRGRGAQSKRRRTSAPTRSGPPTGAVSAASIGCVVKATSTSSNVTVTRGAAAARAALRPPDVNGPPQQRARGDDLLAARGVWRDRRRLDRVAAPGGLGINGGTAAALSARGQPGISSGGGDCAADGYGARAVGPPPEPVTVTWLRARRLTSAIRRRSAV